MASLKDVEQVADDLTKLADELRKEIRNNASFERLIQITDQISEHAVPTSHDLPVEPMLSAR